MQLISKWVVFLEKKKKYTITKVFQKKMSQTANRTKYGLIKVVNFTVDQ